MNTRIVEREINAETREAALAAGFSPVAARLIAGRGIPPSELQALMHPRLSGLDGYAGLPDIRCAAERLADAVTGGEIIAFETDHDVDGVSSHAVLLQAFTRWFGVPRARILSFIGHRLKEGYGLSEGVKNRILASVPRPSLVVTADNGSSDEARIAALKSAGIEVIVTDHHELPENGPPASALACVTPAREDCAYPDRYIAGCMVAWLLACAVRQALMDRGALPATTPNLGRLLDYVAAGTIADCVSLSRSVNNRAVVRAGLQLMNRYERPCWRSAQAWLRNRDRFCAEDLAFVIGPRINARGRLDEAMAGVRFLTAETDREAVELAGLLDKENIARKEIEHRLRDAAFALAQPMVVGGATALAVYLADGHPGVHGIVASRLVEAFGRPSICLSPKPGAPDEVVGSARGIEGIHIRDALQACSDSLPVGAMPAFGGHAGAGGLTLQKSRIDDFRDAFDRIAAAALKERTLGPVIRTDGPLSADELTLDTIDAIAALDPFGRAFEAPVFDNHFQVDEVRPIGDGTHLRLRLRKDGTCVTGVWFRALKNPGDPLPVQAADSFHCIYRLLGNTYKGQRSPQVMVEQQILTPTP